MGESKKQFKLEKIFSIGNSLHKHFGTVHRIPVKSMENLKPEDVISIELLNIFTDQAFQQSLNIMSNLREQMLRTYGVPLEFANSRIRHYIERPYYIEVLYEDANEWNEEYYENQTYNQ